MTPGCRHWAAATFEAARKLSGGGADSRSRRMHGHSFRVELETGLPEGWGGVRGAEAHALQSRLQEITGALDYRDLGSLVSNPTDERLVRWIAARLDLPLPPPRIRLWAGPEQGVVLGVTGAMDYWLRDRFESAHRLPNVPSGHKCGRMHGHGFEVVLKWRGGRNWGQTSNGIGGLSPIWRSLRNRLHLACLNEIEGLEIPTSEMLSSWIWNRLKPDVPTLSGVTVHETASCGAHFDGTDYRIWKDRSFDSATLLRAAPENDPRRRLHGHTYLLRLGLSAPLDEVMGWTVDFGDVKSRFSPIFRKLDHQPLHEVLPGGDNVSILNWIREQAVPTLPALKHVGLRDTPATGSILSW